MNVLCETSEGPRALTPHEAELRLAQVERFIADAKRGLNVDELRVKRLQHEARTLYAIVNPEVAYDEILESAP